MFWTFILITLLAFMLVKFGAFSVWITVLAGGLKLALLVIAGFVIAVLWRKVFGAKRD